MAVAATRAGQTAAPPAAEHRPDRPREGRAQARLDAVRARRGRDAARRGLPDHLRVLALAAARRSALPERRGVRRLLELPAVLTSSTWWTDVGNTLFITVISVALELVLGMLIAQAMYRAIFARTAIRASVLVPYGAVTVVAAFAWRLAFDPATGFAVALFNLDPPPLTTRGGSFFIIIFAEVWKTTPFIALLLLGGLALVPDDLYKAAKMDGASLVAALREDHAAADPPRADGRGPVPHARRVPHLRRGLHHHPRRQQHRDGVGPRATTSSSTGSISGLGSAVAICIFVCVMLIAFIFFRFLGASPERR